MRKVNNKKGFTLIELIVVISIIGILLSVAVPKFISYAERSKIVADQYNISILNRITSLYYITNTSLNPFKDDTKNNEELIGVLVSSGYITSIIQPQSEDATFTWLFDEEEWYLMYSDSFYTITLVDGLSMSSYLLGAWNGSETYSGTSKDVVIPRSLDGTVITNIGQNTFKYIGLIAIAFQEGSGITRIHGHAFENNDLSSIIFPDFLERIDGRSFFGNNLTEIELPDSLSTIEQKAFDKNEDLNKIKIGSNVSIGNKAFGEFTDSFNAAYEAADGGEGTYILNDEGRWVKQ
jgi:prepilin-type N-terminal cleavage/methylation domain-containing protein